MIKINNMKTLIKILKIFIIALISIITLTFLYLFISNKIFLASKNQTNIDYLKNNQTTIGNNFNTQIFDNNVNTSNVILLGEIHGFADNQKLDEFMFKYLNKNLGFKYYIAEMDSLNSKKLNTFLSSDIKNEKLLKEVVLAIKKRIPQQSSQELLKKWNNLYDYNKTLNDSSKIVVLGIDTNFDDSNGKISRDSAMIENFNHIISKNHLQNEKFYGLFGLFHTLQKSMNDKEKPFAERLLENKYKVTSIVSYTLDSEMYLPKNDQFPTPENQKINWVNADGPMMLIKGILDFKELAEPNSISIFNLNVKNSPYKSSQNLIQIKSRLFGENFTPKENLKTTDYFQYVAILRNSEALTPIQ